jgi:hypothetical protein
MTVPEVRIPGHVMALGRGDGRVSRWKNRTARQSCPLGLDACPTSGPSPAVPSDCPGNTGVLAEGPTRRLRLARSRESALNEPLGSPRQAAAGTSTRCAAAHPGARRPTSAAADAGPGRAAGTCSSLAPWAALTPYGTRTPTGCGCPALLLLDRRPSGCAQAHAPAGQFAAASWRVPDGRHLQAGSDGLPTNRSRSFHPTALRTRCRIPDQRRRHPDARTMGRGSP